MLSKINKSHIVFIIALVIGSIGAIGQSYLLYHDLANSYPYKMMDYKLYDQIANIGLFLSPLISIFSGFYFGLKRYWLALIMPVMASPLSFAIIFKVISIFQSSEKHFGFDGKTPIDAAQEFYLTSASLAITGLLVSLICSCILFYISKEKRLP